MTRSAGKWVSGIFVLAFAGAASMSPALAMPLVFTSDTDAAADAGFRDVSLSVSTSVIITDLDLTVGWGKCGSSFSGGLCTGGGFPFPTEAYMDLFSPLGTSLRLFGPGFFSGPDSSVNVVNTFDDEALNPLPTTISSGTFRPAGGALSIFDSTDSLGTWRLRIGDTVGADPIVLDFFTLTFNGGGENGGGNGGGTPVPAPATLLLLGAGLLLARRRQRT